MRAMKIYLELLLCRIWHGWSSQLYWIITHLNHTLQQILMWRKVKHLVKTIGDFQQIYILGENFKVLINIHNLIIIKISFSKRAS